MGLLNNSAPEDEIAEAVLPALVPKLVESIAAIRAEEQPAAPFDILAAATLFLRLVAADWSKEARADFLDGVLAEFQDMPGTILLDALTRARRRVSSARALVVWVAEDIEPKAVKLRVEREACEKLLSLHQERR